MHSLEPSDSSIPTPVSLALIAGNLLRGGFPHGFSLRAGGVSEGAFASLNFGPGDVQAHVAENVARFARATGFDANGLRQVVQVHGARVVDAAEMPDDWAPREEGDALVLAPGSDSRARAVGVRVADCVPILVGSLDTGAVAAIHAGWRGVVVGIIDAAIAQLAGAKLVAAVGPCIGPCCFEVSSEVGDQIMLACKDDRVIARREGGKAYVDLRLAVERQLAAAGVKDVEHVGGCTRCEGERFFSYRRDGAQSGRHLAAIALRG